MSSESGAITVGCADTTVVVAVHGPGNLFNSYPLHQFFATMLAASADTFVLNLADCTQLDSTFMGVMAGLSQRLRATGKRQLRVANAPAPVRETMGRLGLHHLVELADVVIPDLESPTRLEPAALSKLDRGRHMLHAHLELSGLSDANRAEFSQLIDTLHANVRKHQSDTGG